MHTLPLLLSSRVDKMLIVVLLPAPFGPRKAKICPLPTWKRLGYSDELAELRTQIICTGEESELEWLAEQVRNRQFRREEKACAYKLVGDVRMKQGQTREVFANYRKALEYEMPSYVRTELYRIFINDLNDGSRQAKSFGKKTDITVVLDKWLDKYESIEDIKKIVQTVTVK